uniref:Uncharacterized protein n=1 Tax=Rhizophora mucronata TaxID=61149 RepID=A0A2P2PQ34_RHIMU
MPNLQMADVKTKRLIWGSQRLTLEFHMIISEMFYLRY